MEVRVQLQCCIDDLASQTGWSGCSAVGFGQCLRQSSQAEENRQQRTKRDMGESYTQSGRFAAGTSDRQTLHNATPQWRRKHINIGLVPVAMLALHNETLATVVLCN